MFALYFVLWSIYGVLIIVYLVKSWSFINFLKAGYPSEYEKIGSIHLIMNNTLVNNWKFMRYILSDGIRPQTVRERVRSIKSIFIYLIFYTIIIFALFIMILFSNVGTRSI